MNEPRLNQVKNDSQLVMGHPDYNAGLRRNSYLGAPASHSRITETVRRLGGNHESRISQLVVVRSVPIHFPQQHGGVDFIVTINGLPEPIPNPRKPEQGIL